MTTAGFGFPPLKGEKAGNTLPERTGQMSYQPASGHAPAARDSNPCNGSRERRKAQSAADRVCLLGKQGDCWPAGTVGQGGLGAGRYSRLGGVHGRGRVADVLRALEDAEGQAGQEVPC